jgi:hypothetical protein
MIDILNLWLLLDINGLFNYFLNVCRYFYFYYLLYDFINIYFFLDYFFNNFFFWNFFNLNLVSINDLNFLLFPLWELNVKAV